MISIPDDVFALADREALRLGISRSELVARALRLLIAAERNERITKSYDAAFVEPDTAADAVDAARSRAAKRALLDVER